MFINFELCYKYDIVSAPQQVNSPRTTPDPNGRPFSCWYWLMFTSLHIFRKNPWKWTSRAVWKRRLDHVSRRFSCRVWHWPVLTDDSRWSKYQKLCGIPGNTYWCWSLERQQYVFLLGIFLCAFFEKGRIAVEMNDVECSDRTLKKEKNRRK